jgi:hypothetical protein
VVRLDLDLALRREPGAQQRRGNRLRQLGLGEQQERLGPFAHHAQRRDDAALRRQQQGLAGLTRLERHDLVGDHPLEKVDRLGARDRHVAAVETVGGSAGSLHLVPV